MKNIDFKRIVFLVNLKIIFLSCGFYGAVLAHFCDRKLIKALYLTHDRIHNCDASTEDSSYWLPEYLEQCRFNESFIASFVECQIACVTSTSCYALDYIPASTSCEICLEGAGDSNILGSHVFVIQDTFRKFVDGERDKLK